MIRNMTQDEARKNVQLWQDYTGEAQDWISHRWENLDFYLNKHFSEDMETEIIRRGQIPLCIPIATPIIRHQVAVATANKPGWRVSPDGYGDEYLAQVQRAMLYYIWEISNGDLELADAVEKFFVMGRGCMRAYIDRLADDGRGEIKIESLSFPHEVLVDPNSRRRLWRDADRIVISRSFTQERAMRIYPDYETEIMSQLGAYADENTGAATNRAANQGQIRLGDLDYRGDQEKVRIIESYLRVPQKYKALEPTSRETRLEPKVVAAAEMGEEDMRLVENGEYAKPVTLWKLRTEMHVSVGDAPMFVDQMNISDFPIVGFDFIHTGTPFPVGMMDFLKDLQLSVDKRHSLMIYAAGAASNPRTYYQEGSIDYEHWVTNMSVPGFLGGVRRGFEYPREVVGNAGPTIATLGRLSEMDRYDMQFAANWFGQQAGDPEGTPRTLGATRVLERNAMRPLGLAMRSVYAGLEQLGNVVLEMIQKTDVYKRNKIIRIADLDGQPYAVEINKSVTKQLGLQAVEQILNDVTVGKYDVKIEAGSTIGEDEVGILQHFLELADRGAMDIEGIIRQNPFIKDKEGLLQRIGERQKLMAQLEQAMQMNEKLQQTVKSLESEVRHAKMDRDVAGHRAKLNDALYKTQAQAAGVRRQMANLIKEEKKITDEAKKIVRRPLKNVNKETE